MTGSGDELKGGLKEGLGKLSGDRALEAEGKTQKTGGRARRKAGGAATEAGGGLKEALGGALDSPTLKAKGKTGRLRGRAERA